MILPHEQDNARALRALLAGREPSGWMQAPTLRALAADLGVSERTAKRRLRALEAAGAISRLQRGPRGLWFRVERSHAPPPARPTQAAAGPKRHDPALAAALDRVIEERRARVEAGTAEPLRDEAAYRARVLADWADNPDKARPWLEPPSSRTPHRPAAPATPPGQPCDDRIRRAVAAARRHKEWLVHTGRHAPVTDWGAWAAAVERSMRADPDQVDQALAREEAAARREAARRREAEERRREAEERRLDAARERAMIEWHRGLPADARDRVEAEAAKLVPEGALERDYRIELEIPGLAAKLFPPPSGWLSQRLANCASGASQDPNPSEQRSREA